MSAGSTALTTTHRVIDRVHHHWTDARATALPTGAAGLSEDLPFGGILADLMAGRQHISNQYEYVGSSWGGVMFGLENKDLMI